MIFAQRRNILFSFFSIVYQVLLFCLIPALNIFFHLELLHFHVNEDLQWWEWRNPALPIVVIYVTTYLRCLAEIPLLACPFVHFKKVSCRCNALLKFYSWTSVKDVNDIFSNLRLILSFAAICYRMIMG